MKYFREAVKSWRGVRPLFHKSQSFPPDISDYWMKPNAHSETYWDRRLMANRPIFKYADFDIEAKFKKVAVQGFYKFIKDEENFSGEST